MQDRSPLRRLCLLAGLALLSAPCLAARPLISADKANVFAFAPLEARYVRVVLWGSSSGDQPCLDELEVRADAGADNLASAKLGATASASSCLGGYAAHRVEHLNDGEYGNSRSWIPLTNGEEWAQIELAAPAAVSSVVLSRDRQGAFGDRVPAIFEIRLSMDGHDWTTARRVEATVVSRTSGYGVASPPMPVPPPPSLDADGHLTGGPAAAAADVPTVDALGFANLALRPEARPAASSVYSDGAAAFHQVAHLNDGRGGNERSWISTGEPSWAETDLGATFHVYRVGLANDREGRYADRVSSTYRILVATDYDPDSTAKTWHEVYASKGERPLLGHTEIAFTPVRARWVRIDIASAQSEARLDEIEVYGSSEPIAADKVEQALEATRVTAGMSQRELLEYAFVGEEHAWLKTYGRADLDPALVPYNGRVQEYPRHVADDVLPLPPAAGEPTLDGRLDDECWRWASRGVARVAHPYDFAKGPLVTQAVRVARTADDLLVAVEADRLLSSHVAILSTEDWQSWGALAVTEEGLTLRAYDGQGALVESTPVEGAWDEALRTIECRIPLSSLPGLEASGLRVGLGMGGRHTPAAGRSVHFAFSPFSVAEVGPCLGGRFRVRVAVPPGGETTEVSTTASGTQADLSLAPGEARELDLVADRGPIGPQLELSVVTEAGESYALHLFRYDPLERTLALMEPMLERLAAKGIPTRAEARWLRECRARQEQLAARAPDPASERSALYEARLAKRHLFLRDPDLAPLASVLFVKRQPFQPSHIYTDYTDAPFRPGGAVCRLEIPTREGKLAPEEATLTHLFESAAGIARDPVATWDLSRVYFSYRPTADGFYHVMAMGPDGSDLREITDGPYHDLYPCPLPDGNVALITTRCASRVFCFRWTSSVLFRMGPDGGDMRPLSYSSLSEWAPSVMNDGRLIWTRWEYIDKGADFSQTLWSIRPDGTEPELVFGNTILQPNGYACGREVPGTSEISCTLVSHFGDINGPIALLDTSKGRLSPEAITSITPEVPWPGMWPATECFRDPVPLSRDLFLCSHAPRDVFGLYAIDRYGNREVLHLDPSIGSMGPTLFRKTARPPVLPDSVNPKGPLVGKFALLDVYQGISPTVPRGSVKWLRVVEEVRHNLSAGPNVDHADFMKWYASPVDIVSGPFGWPAYTAKASLGLVPVAEDGSARFEAPAGKQLYFEALDEDFNELQRMRSNVHLQPGESRTCVGCHEGRNTAPPAAPTATLPLPGVGAIQATEWEGRPFSFPAVVQPVLDRNCVSCHDASDATGLDFTGRLDEERVPASYRTLITRGLVRYLDCGWNSGGCEKAEPMTFGSLRSRLWEVLDAEGGHHDVALSRDETLRLKTWIDLNCPLWPDYVERRQRPAGEPPRVATAP